jgi:xanthine/CO dehydrogenase XdhC/CoxF family maturation factor
MSVRRIIEAFAGWRAAGRNMALATVYATEGSTYTKAGHRIVIADNGDYAGLISGGCLEGDLAEHARDVIGTGEPRAITYDLRDEADEIWGLGIGCNGLIRLLLQRLDAAGDYEPFATLARCQAGTQAARSAVVVDSGDPAIPLGATLTRQAGDYAAWLLPAELADTVRARLERPPADGAAELRVEGHCTVLYAAVPTIPRLLVLGAGPDAVPLVRIADELGWCVTVADHRPAYLANPLFAPAGEHIHAEPLRLASQLSLDRFTAAVVMSHHLDTDRAYLGQLAGSSVRYIGLLGPRARRDRLLAELGAAGGRLSRRLHGPVGLDLGGDSPEAIALAIAAEIQQHIA